MNQKFAEIFIAFITTLAPVPGPEPSKNPPEIGRPLPIVAKTTINPMVPAAEKIQEIAPLPVPQRQVAPTPAQTATSGLKTVVKGNSSGNTYFAGNCTWYAKSMRPDLPNNLGNADTWTSRAAAQGIPTGYVPRAGAVGQYGMHVVYVTSVNADGTFNLSEMNYKGYGVVSTRSNVSTSGWSFIY